MLVKLLTVGVCAAALGMAQGVPNIGGAIPGGGRSGGGGMGGGGMGGGMGASRMSKMDSFTQMLTLDKDQKKQVKSMLDEAAKGAAPLRDQIVKGKAELGAAVAAGKSADEIAKLVESYSLQKAQMAQLETKAFTAIFNTLSPEQKSRPCPGRGGVTVACSAQVYDMFPDIFMKKNWDSD
jgi:Spy/CpxP family protein refolding chaperone